MDFENSQTKKNLEAAFAGESQAHTKYRYYASRAKKDGFVQISNIFMETALNESEHAKLWFKELHGAKSPAPSITCAMLLPVRITSGRPCTTSLPRPPTRRLHRYRRQVPRCRCRREGSRGALQQACRAR